MPAVVPPEHNPDRLHDQPGQSKRVAPALDYRLLLVGSMLPDIIDKPLGMWLLRESLSSGRIFGHTLLLAGLLAGVGVYLYLRHRRVGTLTLALGTVAHLILDEMWRTPTTFLWPLYGWSFPQEDIEGWLPGLFNSMLTEPAAYTAEIIGAALLALFFGRIIWYRRLTCFLRNGRVG